MISVAEARGRIIDALTPLAAEQIPLAAGLGRVLARDIAARRTQPPLAVSAMDGYAVRSADVASVPCTLKLAGYVQAGGRFAGTVGPGDAVRIFTGAPVPDGADAIVIQENTEADGKTIHVIDGEAPTGRFVRPAGLDFREGEVLLKAGRVLTARDIGLAAAMNLPWLAVRRRPRIAILATGDEIVMPGDPIGPNQIVSSNAMTLAAFVTAMGGEPIDLGIAPDDPAALRLMAEGAKGADMLVTTGGASVGDHDLVRDVLGEQGLNIDFWRIAMRPGKPLMFGTVRDVPLMGLPGNPVSTLVCAVIFLGPALGAMLGIAAPGPTVEEVASGCDLGQNDEREDYLRATLDEARNGSLVATPFGKQDSSMFALTARADCLVIRAPFAPPAPAGSRVAMIRLGRSLIHA